MRSTLLAAPALLAVGLLLTSCSGSAGGAAGPSEDTVSLTTPTGAEIDIPADPQAALGFYTTDLDILITLGFDLAGTQPIRDDFTAFPEFFPQEELAGLETFGNYPEFNLEAVLEAQPDFILNGLGYEEDLDAQLQKIAPTYTYNAFDGGDWRDVVAQAAADLGRESQWQEWVDRYDARVADIRARLDEAGIDPVVADIGYWNGQVQTSCYGVPCLVFADLGLRIAPQMNATEEGLPASEDYTELSGEQVGQLDGIDVVFTSADESGEVWVDTDEALVQNALWQNLAFVKNGEYYGYNYEMSYGSPSGQDAFLTVVEKALLGMTAVNLIHRVVVQRTERLSPGMVRVVFGGEGLAGFVSTGVGDEYLRVFFPQEGQAEPELPYPTENGYWDYPEGVEPAPMRTYTVRAWDAAARELTIDFVVHDGGVAAAWALRARPGDVVGVNTPRGLYAPEDGIRWQLLIADATGLPAAARLAELAPAGVRTRVVLEVPSAEDELPIAAPAGVDVHWVHGGNGHGPTRIEEILKASDLPDGPGYVWVAGETKATRGVRRYLRHGLGLPAGDYKVVGYWTENAEAWRERYDALDEDTRARLMAMWDDESRPQEDIEDEYEAELEKLGL